MIKIKLCICNRCQTPSTSGRVIFHLFNGCLLTLFCWNIILREQWQSHLIIRELRSMKHYPYYLYMNKKDCVYIIDIESPLASSCYYFL